MKKSVLILIILILVFQNSYSQTSLNSATFGALYTRLIGSATMSGRITAIDGVNSEPRILYVGSAGGGVWKTVNGGAVFKSVFDKYCQSIGALTIDQKNPNVIWVGTGESNMRNTVAIGNGMYKSDDGGDNWKRVGLEKSEHISKIVVDPKNSDIVYVAVPGALWSDSEDRGLYKTFNGGETWEKIFYIDEKTGCADIVMDPNNPNILYASMWQFRRKPYTFSSGGETSGLFKSTDGGKNWNRIDKAFDEDNLLGRICLAISPVDSKHLYAIAESKNTGLFESLDGGLTWTRNSATGNVVARPFYFSVLAVDPTDENRIYRPAYDLSISDDGGKSFRESSSEGGYVHGDYHAIWINPKNPEQVYVGTDGGVFMSLDRGNNFVMIHNLPVSQFYHVAYDLDKPYYNVYGGLQDNGSWMAPSSTTGGIDNEDWKSIGFGDGFYMVPDHSNSDFVYWESQGGNIFRYNQKNFENKDIRPQPMKGEDKLRFNWNTPIVQSVINPGTIYLGSQYLYKTSDKGETWERISPDLTTNNRVKQEQEESGGLSVDNSAAENHCTIFAVCESPVDDKLIWVGTDDGNLQVTENGGTSWTNVIKNVKGVPDSTWVSSIDASAFDRRTAFVTFDGHAGGDMNTYIYKTTDLGKTWKSISTDQIEGYAHKVKQDIASPDLLFAGTVFGLYVSIDGGNNWAQYAGEIPKCEVRDITIQPERGDLLIATHGRGIIIVDDLTPMRKLSSAIMNEDAALLPSREAYINGIRLGSGFSPNVGMYIGQNAPEDAQIIYYLKKRAITGEVKVDIYNSEGILVKSIPGTKRKGINRVTWNMRLTPPRTAPGVTPDQSGFIGPFTKEGIYTVKLSAGDKVYTGTLEIIHDPNSPYSKEDIAVRDEATLKAMKMHEELAFVVTNINKVKGETQKLETEGKISSETADTLIGKLEALRKKSVATKESRGITGEERLREKITDLYTSFAFFGGKPTQQQLDRIEALQYEINNAGTEADEIYRIYLSKVNEELKNKGMDEIKPMSEEEFNKNKTGKPS
ncbi:MAG: glycosyl hydrolase [Bacteroidetes bacterium]|nr:glycosyl hydrolase [Bacteroidota bacterium]